jgi:hypothetical protein
MKLRPCRCGNSEKFKEHQVIWFNVDGNGRRTGEHELFTKYYCSKCLEVSILVEGEESIGENRRSTNRSKSV